ncbi:hypothetical protein ATANTOWER_031683 [Ataeniobius toweri]|uniref:Uncharacterized protein n=1 Tax=Ataeniobius toweri TaxID=208326 RepID=A0ABU7AL02_9TELE|nr:hypothetical protein [Ataeniobius toweri]
MLSVVDSKGTFYGGHINPFYGNRYNLYKAGLNPHYSPNKPMTRHNGYQKLMTLLETAVPRDILIPQGVGAGSMFVPNH